MNVIDWIRKTLEPQACTSEDLFYNQMDSQSGHTLPVIYQPFDAGNRAHWRDRGALYDFLFATEGEGKRLLDFGPGDGWPSLIMAPFAREIVGVEGSHRRVDVCTANAERMGMSNVSFVFVEPGRSLPFEAGTFDGAMAASSIEQTPDPLFSLRELHRVLKPGGRLRIMYEDLDRYRDGEEREATILAIDGGTSKIVFYDRDIAGERATMYGITLSMPAEDVTKHFSGQAGYVAFEHVNPTLLEEVRPRVTLAQVCTLQHPSGKTLVELLRQVGFGEVRPTGSGMWYAGAVLDEYPEAYCPRDLDGVDRLLKPLIRIGVGMKAYTYQNPPITALK